MAYYGLTTPEPLTPQEMAAKAERVERMAEQGEAGFAVSYVAKVDLVTRAADRCAAIAPAERNRSGDCRFAQLGLPRYRERTEDVLSHPTDFPEPQRAAAARYREAARRLEADSSRVS